MPAHLSKPPVVFISYAREDEEYKGELVKQLNVLEAQGVISNWHDALLVAGEQWNEKIVEQLNASHIILLLISPDFLNSRYIHNVEMKRASERHKRGEVVVVPLMVRPVNSWKNVPFGELKLGALNALPGKAKFIAKWGNRDEAFANVAAGIQIVAEKLNEAAKTEVSVAAPSSSIPRSPVFGFVARRDAEGRDIVARLKEELAPGKNKLVTLSGPGGIGKTTLAAEATRSLEGEFGSRVVWSSAEKRTDFTLPMLLDDIATQTGHPDLRTLAPGAKEADLLALVAAPPTIIVLDNCETIALAEQKRIEEWLAPAQCSALFTSRPRITSTLNIHVAAMSWEEAQEFLQKLVAQTQGRGIFSDDIRRRIHQTAEANPFVMQWVVAQIDAAQEPRAVLEELAHGKGDAAQRVFDRSFNLPRLGDDGRATLLALSLFIPSASRPALAEVAGFGHDEGRVNEAIKNLYALWLIKGIDENSRFTIEGLTRSLTAARLLKEPQAAEFRQRFIAYFQNYAETHARPTPQDYDALEVEKDNLLSALDTAFAFGRGDSVIEMAHTLTGSRDGMLSVRGYWNEVIRYTKQALDAAKASGNEWFVGAIANNLGSTFSDQGNYPSAKEYYELAVQVARKIGAEQGLSATLHELGRLAQSQGELEEARRLYNESLDIKKRLGNQSGIAITLHELGRLAHTQRELEEARRFYNESLDIEKRLDNQSSIASSLHQLAMLAQDQGELKEARRLYDESLEIKRRLGNRSGIAITLAQLGVLAAQEGDKAEAVRLLREALSIFEKLKSSYAEMARQNLAQLEGESS